MAKRYPRKQVKETVVHTVQLEGTLADALETLNHLVATYGHEAVLVSSGYEGSYFDLERTREETDSEYHKRLTKLRQQETNRKAALDRKRERLRLAQQEADEEERALYEVLHKKFGERQADG